MTKTWRKIKKLTPKTALEKKLYAFYLKWVAWHDTRDKEQAKVLTEDDFGSEKWKLWGRKYDSTHPKPRPPKELRLDFSDRRLGQSLACRLTDGYYRTPKVLIISDEYGTSPWLIKKHSDFGKVAVEVIRNLTGTFTAYPEDHTEKPPSIEKEVFDALPAEYGETAAESYKKDVQEWLDSEDRIAKDEKINELIERAKKGDQLAAADVLHHKIQEGDDSFSGHATKIIVLDFDNVDPA